MKMRKDLLLSVACIALCAACDDNIENIKSEGYCESPQTIAASEVSCDSLPGSIKLKWDKTACEKYEYMKVTYVNPADNKTVVRLISKYCDSLVVENTLRKYGDYTFFLQAYNAGNKAGDVTEVKAMSGRALATVTINKTKVKLTANQLSSDNPEPSEGPIANLIDGDAGTMFHTRWSNPQKPLPQYIQIDFKETHKDFLIWYKNRNWSQVGPEHFDMQISQDGINWETVKTIDSGLPSGGGAEYTSDIVRSTKSFSHFRFVVTKTFGDKKYFNLAEFSFFDADITIDDPEA